MDLRGPQPAHELRRGRHRSRRRELRPEQQLSPTNLNAASAHPAVAPDGRTTVVWTQLPIVGTTGTTEAATDSGPGTSFGDTQILSEQPQSAAEPAVGVDGSGRFTAAWDQAPTATDLSSQILVNVLPANGPPWIGRQLVATGAEVLHPHVAAAPDGSSILTFDGSDGTNQVHAVVRGPTQSAYGPDQLLAEGDALGGSKIAMDAQGNGFATWNNNFPPYVQLTGFDAAGPVLSDVSVPDGGAGQSLAFSVSARDVWSGVSSVDWDFGDGSSGSGTAVTHTYAAPGAYPVVVRAVDGVGNATEVHRTVQVTGLVAARGRGARTGPTGRTGRRIERHQRGAGGAGAPGHRPRAGCRAERHAHLAGAHQHAGLGGRPFDPYRAGLPGVVSERVRRACVAEIRQPRTRRGTLRLCPRAGTGSCGCGCVRARARC